MMDYVFRELGQTLEAIALSWDAIGRQTTLFVMTSPEGGFTLFVVRDTCVHTGTAGRDWRYLREAM